MSRMFQVNQASCFSPIFSKHTKRSKNRLSVSCAAAPPKRVAVVGGGPGGLSLAHALLTLDSGVEHVKVFEKYSELSPAVGGALNINGGAVMLAKMGLMQELKQIGNPMERVVARDTSEEVLFEVDVPSVLPSELKYQGELCAFTVMRQDLQKVLEDKIPQGVMSLGSSVSGIVESPSGVRLKFEDGELSSEEFDLVVGCDGISSKLRALVTGESESKPAYSGIRVLFAVSEPGTYPKETTDLLQWFGDGAYTLVYTAGQGEKQRDIMAVCVDDEFQVDENADYAESDVADKMISILDKTDMPQVCKDLASVAERQFEVGVFYHEPLKSWSSASSRLVLLGDSAHAMPPFLGQGANQAIQDSFCLATSLGKIGSKYETLEDAINAYESIRQPPTFSIMQISRLNGFIETQSGPGAFLRNTLFKTLGLAGIPGQIFVQNAVPRV